MDAASAEKEDSTPLYLKNPPKKTGRSVGCLYAAPAEKELRPVLRREHIEIFERILSPWCWLPALQCGGRFQRCLQTVNLPNMKCVCLLLQYLESSKHPTPYVSNPLVGGRRRGPERSAPGFLKSLQKSPPPHILMIRRPPRYNISIVRRNRLMCIRDCFF